VIILTVKGAPEERVAGLDAGEQPVGVGIRGGVAAVTRIGEEGGHQRGDGLGQLNPCAAEAEQDVVVVDVCGALTIGSDSAALRAILQELTEAGYRNLLVNMAGVTQIDTAGIGELMAAYTNLARVNGTLKLLKLKKLIECVLRATQLDSTFERYETRTRPS
jgi:anti-sigma B factor antagonist